MMNMPIRLIELFAGYGSQALALKYLGIPFEHHFVCEFDKYAMQSYNDIHSTDFKCTDVCEITADDLNITETDKYKYLLTYSFPCTDLSLAGRQGGMERGSGTRSSLLWEVERLLKDCNELPQYLLMENVPQVVSKDNLSLFSEWARFLSGLGYKNYYKILNAKDFGVPQNRERCFMVSILDSEHKEFVFPQPKPLVCSLNSILEDNVDAKYYIHSEKVQKLVKDLDIIIKDVKNYIQPINPMPDGVARTIKAQYNNTSVANLLRTGTFGATGVMGLHDNVYWVRKLSTKECFRLMGVKDSDYEKLTVSNSQLYKQAGNSIVVDVLMAIFENMFIKECKKTGLF